MRRRPGKGRSVSAAMLSALSLFSCSYESGEDDEDRKHKNKVRVEALLPQRPVVGPSGLVASETVVGLPAAVASSEDGTCGRVAGARPALPLTEDRPRSMVPGIDRACPGSVG
jgi:hypothetical protein